MNGRQVIQPELTWTGTSFEPARQIVIDPDGTIAAVEAVSAQATAWPGRAVLPGMVNAHSHAFQRGLRGRGGFRHPYRPAERLLPGGWVQLAAAGGPAALPNRVVR